MSMVIGNGIIANRFIDYSLQAKYLIFAGSVNDSSIQDMEAIEEEEISVAKSLSNHPDAIFVYFSSCSILDTDVSQTAYVQHKARMENFLQNNAKKFLICRLPQVLGLNDTKSSLVKFLVDSISSRKMFELWQNAQKNLIDIDDVHLIVDKILRRGLFLNRVINVASSTQTSVLELVRTIEAFTGNTANCQLIEKGSTYKIDIANIKPIFDELGIDFGTNYISTALNKYFGYLKVAPKLLSVVVPTYNEEHGIDEFYRRTKNVLRMLSPRFSHELIFVNDFSTDNTLLKLRTLAQNDPSVKLVNFSRNFGNQLGITAGINYSKGELVVVIDDDLQDPPEIIFNFISMWDKGYKVVYGVRPKRQGVNPFFKLIAKLYYRIVGGLSETKIPNDTGDFRLMDRAVVENLKKMKEENRYYRGMVAWVGFPQIGVVYERDKRYAGVSTFTFRKYINFAVNGLTSFTDRPLYFSSLAGLFVTAVSFFLALYLIVGKINDPSLSIQGWTSLTVIILFFGGIQLFSIGILGVYIGKIYREVKDRPLYIVESTMNIEDDQVVGHAKPL